MARAADCSDSASDGSTGTCAIGSLPGPDAHPSRIKGFSSDTAIYSIGRIVGACVQGVQGLIQPVGVDDHYELSTMTAFHREPQRFTCAEQSLAYATYVAYS